MPLRDKSSHHPECHTIVTDLNAPALYEGALFPPDRLKVQSGVQVCVGCSASLKPVGKASVYLSYTIRRTKLRISAGRVPIMIGTYTSDLAAFIERSWRLHTAHGAGDQFYAVKRTALDVGARYGLLPDDALTAVWRLMPER